MNKLKTGIYRHYKGHEYKVIFIAQSATNKLHDNELDKVVIYESLEDGKIWFRPLKEFLEEVIVEGEKQARFKFLDEGDKNDWEHRYKRALADYHNLLKQTAREKQDFIKYALTELLQDILPVYDHLKMSVAGLSEPETKNPWVMGVKHVLKQFKEVLSARGVEEIETLGAKFDHETMEALEGTGYKVKREIMPGYKLNGRVIRPAKVIVE